jgi:hypothetical protein
MVGSDQAGKRKVCPACSNPLIVPPACADEEVIVAEEVTEEAQPTQLAAPPYRPAVQVGNPVREPPQDGPRRQEVPHDEEMVAVRLEGPNGVGRLQTSVSKKAAEQGFFTFLGAIIALMGIVVAGMFGVKIRPPKRS